MDNRLPSVPESAQDRDIQLRYGVARVLLVSVDCVRPALVDSHAAMMPYLNVPIPDSCLQPATLGRVLSGVAAGHRRRRRVALSTGSGRRRIIRKRG